MIQDPVDKRADVWQVQSGTGGLGRRYAWDLTSAVRFVANGFADRGSPTHNVYLVVSGLWHYVDLYVDSDISEEHAASILRVQVWRNCLGFTV